MESKFLSLRKRLFETGDEWFKDRRQISLLILSEFKQIS